MEASASQAGALDSEPNQQQHVMKIEDIRAKTDAELEFDLNGLKDLFDARFPPAPGPTATPRVSAR